MRILKSIAAVAISVWLLGCSTASKPDTTAERQRMEALRRQLSQNTNDFRARTILAALLLKQGEAAAGYGELEIIARDAPAFSAEGGVRTFV